MGVLECFGGFGKFTPILNMQFSTIRCSSVQWVEANLLHCLNMRLEIGLCATRLEGSVQCATRLEIRGYCAVCNEIRGQCATRQEICNEFIGFSASAAENLSAKQLCGLSAVFF